MIDETKLSALLTRLDAMIQLHQAKIVYAENWLENPTVPENTGAAILSIRLIQSEAKTLETIVAALRDAGIQSATGTQETPLRGSSEHLGASDGRCPYTLRHDGDVWRCFYGFDHPKTWNHSLKIVGSVSGTMLLNPDANRSTRGWDDSDPRDG